MPPQCRRCGAYRGEYRAGRPVLCDGCLAAVIAAESAPQVIVGSQPMICPSCRQPFTASRRSQTYCGATCRRAAHRARLRPAS